MLAATVDFWADMSETIRAPLLVRVVWDQVSPAAPSSASSALTGCHALSRPAQLLSGAEPLARYATLERGRWPLDGSVSLLPGVIPAADVIGLWSVELSDEAGVLPTPAVLTLTFSQKISPVGLTLRFDEAGYAPQYTAEAYSDNTLICAEDVKNDRTESIWEKPLDDMNKLVLRFTHWSLPHQRVRIGRLIFGVIRTFDNRELVEFSCLRQIDLSRASLPSGELRFSIDNRDGAYDPRNPRGIFAYVEQKQETRAYIGFADRPDELVPLGVFYPVERGVSGGKATFRCLDALSLLDTAFPETQYSGQTLLSVAQTALTLAGITQYTLDTATQSLTTSALVKNKSCRDVLGDIALASRLFLYTRQDDGRLVLGPPPQEDTGYVLSLADSQSPEVMVADKIKTLTVEYTGGTLSVPLNAVGRDRKIAGNPFIATKAQAEQIAAWLTPFLNRVKTLQSRWRQNPALACGDQIAVATRYGELPATIQSQRWVFGGGGLSGETESLLS